MTECAVVDLTCEEEELPDSPVRVPEFLWVEDIDFEDLFADPVRMVSLEDNGGEKPTIHRMVVPQCVQPDCPHSASYVINYRERGTLPICLLCAKQLEEAGQITWGEHPMPATAIKRN